MPKNKRQIPSFTPEVEYHEETEVRIFHCPVSGENVYTWGEDYDKYPEELVYINYLQADEPIYLKQDYQDLYEQWEELEDPDEYDSFMDFLIQSLPKDQDFYVIELVDPEEVFGEVTYYLYQGIYTV
jgi:hypothetical protein